MPGVIYGKADVYIRPGYNPVSGEAYTEVPKNHITTQEAAVLLGAGDSATRVKLKRLKIPFVMVSLDHTAPRHYWKKKRVVALAEKLPPFATPEMVEDLLTMEEVSEMSGAVRSTILRAVNAGQLKMLKYRMPTEQGPQKRTFFAHADVHAWMEWREEQPYYKCIGALAKKKKK